MTIIDIWINCPDQQVADRIADTLVGERLAACANIFPPIRSAFHWKGAVEREEEVPLVIKTRETLFDAVVRRARAIHPYETPSILGLPVAFVNEDYREWVIAETRSPDGD
ncbi:MAG: divalent-cation tolerance protein CutA [Geminicoccaceae bacterium]